MPFIEYRGHCDAVDVPRWQLAEVPAGTPVEVSAEAAHDLTLGGTSEQWVEVPAPAADPMPPEAPTGKAAKSSTTSTDTDHTPEA